MRIGLLVLMMLLSAASFATQVSVGVWLPGVSIGINMPAYPTLVLVPGYPVYYAPQLSANYFFYDGMYWVFVGDNWYASSWYNGPWVLVAPEVVPVFILRVPVYYYRAPPVYFRAWGPHAPPRWGEHWGPAWEQRRRGWDSWNRSAAPPPAPLPTYQRQYEGNRYPRVEQQQALQGQHYRYQPRDTAVKPFYEAPRTQTASGSTPQGKKAAPKERMTPTQGERKSAPEQAPARSGAPVAQHQQPNHGSVQPGQQPPRSQAQDRGQQGKGQQDRGHDKEEQEPRQGHEKGK